MTGKPRAFTSTERLLLEAVIRVLDLPNPGDHREREAFEDQLHERVYRMVGALTGALSSAYSTQTSIIATLGAQAAEPLRYTPETSEQATEREARTAARLAEWRAERARIDRSVTDSLLSGDSSSHG